MQVDRESRNVDGPDFVHGSDSGNGRARMARAHATERRIPAVRYTPRGSMQALVYDISPARWMVVKAASLVSKRACFGALSGLRLVDRPVPQVPGPGWVRLKTVLGGVCGTDLALIALRNHPATILQQFAQFPAVLGHENVAVIDEVGPEVGGWEVGQRVCADPAIGCVGRGASTLCSHCTAGRSSLCEHGGDGRFPPRALIGLNGMTGGSWAGYFLAHQSQLHRVPEGVPDDIAVLVDPISSATHAVLRRRPQANETVLVNGLGIVGLGVVASLRALGHGNRITAVARHGFQAELARQLGATNVLQQTAVMSKRDRYQQVAEAVDGVRLSGRAGNQALVGGFGLTYECTGNRRGLTAALKWTRSRGTVVAVGTTGIARIDTTPIWFDELEVLGANGRQVESLDGRQVHSYDLVLEWLRDGRLDLTSLRARRFRLSDYRSALGALLTRSSGPIVKAAFDPHEA